MTTRRVAVRIVRILALLQRKTLTETKNRTLKCLKWNYSTVRSMKNVAVSTEDGAFALFFRPHPRGIWQRKSRHPQEFAIQCPGVSPGGGGEGGLGAGGIDWFWIRVRGQFEIKILTVRGDSDINTTDFIWIIGKNKLEPAINWNW